MRDNVSNHSEFQNHCSKVLVHNTLENYHQIDFVKFIRAIGSNFWFIFFSTTISILFALGVTLYAPKQHKSTSYISAPSIEQYSKLLKSTGIQSTPLALFGIFLNKLASPQNFNLFIDKHFAKSNSPDKSNRPSIQNQNLKQNLVISKNKEVLPLNPKIDKFTALANGFNAEFTVTTSKNKAYDEFNNDYFTYTNQKVLEELVNNQKNINQIQLNDFEKKIERHIEILKTQYAFNISKLEAQIYEISKRKNSQTTDQFLLHLQKELANYQYDLNSLITTGKSNDTNLLDLKLKVEQLKNLSFDISDIKLFTTDGLAKQSANNINSKLIIFLGGTLGLIFSLTVIFIRINMKIRRELDTLSKDKN